MNNKYRLAWRLVAAHTFLIVAVFGLSFLPWKNPDSSIAFLLMVLVEYFIDFPIGMLFEKIIKPIKTDNFALWIAISFSWFAVLGGLYWFCIGVIINKIRQKKITNENIS